MKTLVAIAGLLFTLPGISQEVKVKEDKIPGKIQKSIPDLSDYLTLRPRSTTEKVESIYEWITENISYDYDRLSQRDYFTGVDPKKVLKSKSAICNGYVELMKAMLDEIGVRNMTVEGYVRDEYWAPGKLTVMESHAWIAMEIDGKWYLADPTWDAGYVGRVPKKVKEYEPKTYRKTEWKNKIKQAKILKKREDKEKERKAKYDEEPVAKDKIDFVQFPTKDYFMIHPDSFLLTHLPIVPMWQLRSDYISIADFSTGLDSIRLRLNQNGERSINFDREIDRFMAKDFLQQMLVLGNEGNDFNVYNPSVKALKYYNFMALVHNKNLQKLARGTRYEINSSKRDELYALNDTIIKYNKLFKKAEKGIYKDIKAIDKSRYKSTSALSKENLKYANKIFAEQDRMVDYIKKGNEKIEKNFESLNNAVEKIEENYPGAFNYTKKGYLKEEVLKVWADSIKMQKDSLIKVRDDFAKLRDKTNFNALLSNVEFMRSLMIAQIEMVKENNYRVDDYILEVDTLIGIAGAHSVMLFADSLKLELIGKRTNLFLRNANNYVRKARTDFKEKETNNELSDPTAYEEYMNAQLLEILEIVEDINRNSLKFQLAVLDVFKSYRTPKEVVKLMEEIVELKEEKYDYISEYVDADHERNQRLISIMDEKSREWKVLYAPPKK